jgi:ribosomal protein S18 acetylase RimI-like enzyme
MVGPEEIAVGQQETALRAAHPTLEEGREFARNLDTAAEGFFRLWLGRAAVEILAEVFVQPDHDLSYQNVIFAERDQVLVGMVSGYTAERHRRSSLRPLKRAAGSWNVRFHVVSFVFAPFLRIIDTIDDGDFYIQAIAVDRAARGGGVGGDLMDSMEDHAIATGSARLVLDVSAENQGARRFYEGRGMAVASRWPERWAIPKFKMLRMAKSLRG